MDTLTLFTQTMLEDITSQFWTWLPWAFLAVFAVPAWHIQWLAPLIYYFLFEAPTDVAADCLFAPNVRVSRCYPFACDINNHKSNSTYFADMDISQVELISRLVSRSFISRRKQGAAVFPRLGGAGGVFLKEIKMWQQYQVSSKILTWDDKWVYIMTRFESVGQGQKSVVNKIQPDKRAYAIMLTKLVFKQGRVTLSPERAFEESGLIPLDKQESDADSEDLPKAGDALSGDDTTWTRRRIEETRKKGLELVGNMLSMEVFKNEEVLGSFDGARVLKSMF